MRTINITNLPTGIDGLASLANIYFAPQLLADIGTGA